MHTLVTLFAAQHDQDQEEEIVSLSNKSARCQVMMVRKGLEREWGVGMADIKDFELYIYK